MSLTGALNTIQAGLQVTQSALQIVGANVANAQTPGYVRKTQDQISTAAGNSISVRVGVDPAPARPADPVAAAQRDLGRRLRRQAVRAL